MKKGFALIELFVLIVVLILLLAMFSPILISIKEKSNRMQCKINLLHISQCMNLYKKDYGKDILYPQTNGAGFISSLYKVKLLLEPQSYLCPSTADHYGDDPDIIETIFEGDKKNHISYAGRKNLNQDKYPGIFKNWAGKNQCLTPIASDDWQDTPNHENGQLVHFLFIDGHVESLRDSQAKGNDYELFKSKKNDCLADPLTN
ncbi:MAG: hypothetical protein HUU50_08120 [Candidatus Brocadiae bacterium]|nr:hypothetical protein [Candidatus Brocadiia bacterium]